MTDKELIALLPKLPLDQQIEHVIAKYIGGACARYRDGETPANVGDAGIAKELVGRMKRLSLLPMWRPIAEVPREVTRAILFWPAFKLDDDGNLSTERIALHDLVAVGFRVGGQQWEGGPEVESTGEYFGDEWEYGDPTLFQLLPTASSGGQ